MFRLHLSFETCCNKYENDYYYEDYDVACGALKKLRDGIIAEYPKDFDNDREIDIDKDDCFKMHNNYDIEEFFIGIEPIDGIVRKDSEVYDILDKVLCY